MDPLAVSESREVGRLNAVKTGSVSERIKAFNGLAKERNLSEITRSKCESHEDSLPSKISELMKLGDLENASSHALFGVVNRILDESIEKTNEDIPQQVASVLKLLVQELEQRVSQQADNMVKHKNMFKSREDRFHSKLKALETVATETNEAYEIVNKQLQQIKIEKCEVEEEKQLEKQNATKLRKENESLENMISSLNEELRLARKSYKEKLRELETKDEETKDMLQKKISELGCLLANSRKKINELEEFSESKPLRWTRGMDFIDSQLRSVQELRLASEFIKQEILRIKNIYAEEFNHLGLNLKHLMDAAQNYHNVLEENQKLQKENQDLKGNIEVYCRVRPLLPGQSGRQTTIQYIGENGELAVANPLKPEKDNLCLFKLDKVFSPAATQEEVFRDVRPLIRSVLDGYNVGIFACGQTGSGKTHTMTGPNATSIVDWGLNYRALNDLFNISQKRCSSTAYDIGVQMIEIYNEQVHDLLCHDTSQKRLGIWNTCLPNGLDVPDSTLYPVNSITDILELMNIGLLTRSVGTTALNERSSQSHSILTVHVRGTDLKTNAISHGCLHLVDLASSERICHTEATDYRLHDRYTSKSVSTLGDVISALACKRPHVPYGNSKLTQVLQSSLGGQAKILMFVHLDPQIDSYSETIKSLKFSERISRNESGAAQGYEVQSVRELAEQVASLRDALAKKDEEIRRLQLPKTTINSERNGVSSPKYGYRHFTGVTNQSMYEKTDSGTDKKSDYSYKHSDKESHQSSDDFKPHREFFLQSRLAVVDGPENFPELKFDWIDGSNNPDDDIELWGLGDPDTEERLSDISDGVLTMGTETDSIIEYILFPETTKPDPAKDTTEITTNVESKLPELPKQGKLRSPFSLLSKSSKISGSKKARVNSSALKAPKRRQ
ncbi:kinesin-like protein KIN-14J [Andrographis paniculata]|uniref:kinesin-like protein KIN-14J n=1 Tax=Andrographis paniculata TaxID=175694 RepID=UPI0021E8D432|nr:kinesin-like protein KIN-14J [Andrographis paniculata]XP_051137134.1 kinesin-like protein KIN-14J [Andrographis paniculata]XP_051137135.1 kinesin-like protein KIN-14J [Andrographis paniculata]